MPPNDGYQDLMNDPHNWSEYRPINYETIPTDEAEKAITFCNFCRPSLYLYDKLTASTRPVENVSSDYQ
jgi:hypothetical protein